MAESACSAQVEHADRFIATLQGSPRTATTYRQALTRLSDCLAQAGYRRDASDPATIPISAFRDDLLVVFHDWLTRSRGYQPRTITVYLAAVRRFLVWLDAHDHLPATFSLVKANNRLRAARGRVRRVSDVAQPVDPDIPRIVTYYDGLPLPVSPPGSRFRRLLLLRNRAIVHTLYASAGRVSEVASLTRDQVLDGRLDEVFIRGKGGRDRIILLTPEAQAAIAAYCAERHDSHSGLFVSHGRNTGKALSRWALWRVVKEAARALNLYHGTSPHDFRHYRARQLLHEGMDLDVLQTYLGHADIATTRRIYAPYTALDKVKDQLATFGQSAAEATNEGRQVGRATFRRAEDY